MDLIRLVNELREMELLYVSQTVNGKQTFESGDIKFEDNEEYKDKLDLRFEDGSRIFLDCQDIDNIIYGTDEFDSREIYILLKSGVKWVITKIK